MQKTMCKFIEISGDVLKTTIQHTEQKSP